MREFSKEEYLNDVRSVIEYETKIREDTYTPFSANSAAFLTMCYILVDLEHRKIDESFEEACGNIFSTISRLSNVNNYNRRYIFIHVKKYLNTLVNKDTYDRIIFRSMI